MQIIEVKNNLVKASYDTALENLILSGFVVIKDTVQSFIGQIINLDANTKGNFAIIKLLFTFKDDGIIESYNGSIPNVGNSVEIVHSKELLEIFPIQNPVLFGELAQQNTALSLDVNIFENRLLVCSEKEDDNDLLIENMVSQLTFLGKKVLVFDLKGTLDFSQNRIVAGKDFRLPLNYETINFIYEKGLDNTTAETKALIQEVFLEVQNYVKTLPENFIPFESFKNVVDAQYEEMELAELLLLKNKLLKYYEEGIFAQEKSEFHFIQNSLASNDPTIFDLSKFDGTIQREMIAYAYSQISNLNNDFYVILNVDNFNSDKKLLKQVFMTKNAHSSLICAYSYKYLNELKQLSKNYILFTPIQQQNDFAAYNVFLNKFNPHEFIIYGQATQHIPFIVKLAKLPQTDIENAPEQESEKEILQEQILDEKIKRDVDEIYTSPKSEAIPEFTEPTFENEISEEDFETEIISDELTEEDLDYIDDIDVETFSEPQNLEAEITEQREAQSWEPQIEEQYETEQTEEFPVIEEYPQQEQAEIFEEESTDELAELLNEENEDEPILLKEPPVIDILPASMSSTPIVPIYSADIEPQVQSDELEQGDVIAHPKYGKGTVEKLISYGSKTLCSINFDNVGRRLLDPNLAELKKVNVE